MVIIDQPNDGETLRKAALHTDPEIGELTAIINQVKGTTKKAVTVSLEEALATALTFMEKVLPEGMMEMKMLPSPFFPAGAPSWAESSTPEQGAEHNCRVFGGGSVAMNIHTSEIAAYTFYPVHRGVTMFDKNYSVNVCLVNGKVNDYIRGDAAEPVNLPDPSNVLAATEAVEALIKNNKLQQVYIWPTWHGQKAPAPLLVYLMLDECYVDAQTGEIIPNSNAVIVNVQHGGKMILY
jgi:hypothetical protein